MGSTGGATSSSTGSMTSRSWLTTGRIVKIDRQQSPAGWDHELHRLKQKINTYDVQSEWVKGARTRWPTASPRCPLSNWCSGRNGQSSKRCRPWRGRHRTSESQWLGLSLTQSVTPSAMTWRLPGSQTWSWQASLMTGWPSDSINPYWKHKADLTIIDGVILLGWVFKDNSNRHSDLCQHENRFLGLTSAWKPVFHTSIGRNNQLSVIIPVGIIIKNPPLGNRVFTVQLFILAALRWEILHGLHAAHQVSEKLASMAKDRYFWPDIKEVAKSFAYLCPRCLAHQPS